MRNKLNSYKARYYTNETIRRRVDMRLKKMHRLNGEIKEIDAEFYDEINLISAVS